MTIRRRLLAVLATPVLAAALAGCTAVRNDLGTTSSNCFIAIAVADGVVHHHGHLLGVRLQSVASLRAHEPSLYRAARATPTRRVTQVCLVAFVGRFTNDELARSVGSERGHLAVVELAYPSKRLLATLLVSRLPLGFGHPHA